MKRIVTKPDFNGKVMEHPQAFRTAVGTGSTALAREEEHGEGLSQPEGSKVRGDGAC